MNKIDQSLIDSEAKYDQVDMERSFMIKETDSDNSFKEHLNENVTSNRC